MVRCKKLVFSAFIGYHLVAVVTWVLPDSVMKNTMTPLVSTYVLGLGVWQNWGMFSPDPSNLNMYCHATVWSSSGTSWTYTLPRMDRLDYVQRYEQERYRKYEENINQNRQFLPDLARWMAHQDEQQTGQTPVRIEIYRTLWYVPVPPPGSAPLPQPDWHTERLYAARIVHGEPEL